MKTITRQYKVYNFSELSEDAKRNALNSLYDINIDYDWYGFIYSEAEELGFEITSFDLGRGQYCEIDINESCNTIANRILKDHGKTCSTYIEALSYKKARAKVILEYWTADDETDDVLYNNENDAEELLEELDNDFHHTLENEYFLILEKEYEYLTSEEAIIETIEANEYQFTETGKLFC